MSLAIQLVIAGLIFIAGTATGIKWHVGQDAIKAQEQQEAREAIAREQLRVSDRAAGQHAAQLATLNRKLGDARVQIASLPGRTCLDAGTVGLLNDSGVLEHGTAPSQPASAPAAAAASDRDVAEYIATCRTRYGEVSGQLNHILDIEDQRHKQYPAAP